MPRNRQLTEARIREAAMELLQQQGFESWGVNAIARKAGVDKVLIYRYFGSLEGLLDILVQETSFWPAPDTLPDQSAESFIAATLEALAAELHAPVLLSHPAGRNSVSTIRRKFTADLEVWTQGFRERTRGSISPNQLERLPALIHFQACTGQTNLSPRDLWNQVSPPLDWGADRINFADEELPTELL